MSVVNRGDLIPAEPHFMAGYEPLTRKCLPTYPKNFYTMVVFTSSHYV